jgi:hypothetical protein
MRQVNWKPGEKIMILTQAVGSGGDGATQSTT